MVKILKGNTYEKQLQSLGLYSLEKLLQAYLYSIGLIYADTKYCSKNFYLKIHLVLRSLYLNTQNNNFCHNYAKTCFYHKHAKTSLYFYKIVF